MGENGEINIGKLREFEKRGIQPLQAIDHTKLEYEGFEKEFYNEHQEVIDLGFDEVNAKRRELGIRVEGEKVPKPLFKFSHL